MDFALIDARPRPVRSDHSIPGRGVGRAKWRHAPPVITS